MTWITTRPAGSYPAGMRVDVITLSATGGAVAGSRRDAYADPGGDGQRIRVRWPNAILAAMVRTPAELTALGIDLGSLEEIDLVV